MAPDHPLTTFPSVVLTPHIGGATYDTESNHTKTIADDLCRLMAGARPLQGRARARNEAQLLVSP